MPDNRLSKQEVAIISIGIKDFLENLDEITKDVENGVNIGDTLVMAEFVISLIDKIKFEDAEDAMELKNQVYKVIWIIKEQQ